MPPRAHIPLPKCGVVGRSLLLAPQPPRGTITTQHPHAVRRLARVWCAKEQGVEVSELPGAKSLRRQAELLANMNYDDY